MPLSYQDLPLNLQLELKDHWEDSFPHEAVGLVLDDNSVMRLKNKSDDEDSFFVSAWQILWNLGWSTLRYGHGVSMIYHSHTDTSDPSDLDKTFMQVIARRWPGVNHLIFVPDTEYAVWQYVA